MSRLTIPTIFTAVDRFTQPLNRMSSSVSSFAHRTQRDLRNAGQSAYAMGRSAGMAGIAMLTPLGLMAKSAMDFDDKMTDVAKTTGLSGTNLQRFGDDLLKTSRTTRTGIDELSTIAEIGGQLGIAEKDLSRFVVASNKFNVALGKDFQGGIEEAITSVGKMATLFSDTRNLNIAESIMRTGSAINQLGAMGAGTSANISEFTLRMGALPSALKDTAANTIAMGTYFEELGLDARIASGGMTNLLLVAGQNIGGFAQQMKISANEARGLLSQKPAEFAKKFATSFKGVAPDILAKRLQALKIGTQETIKVVGALGNNQERLTDLQYESAKAFRENTSLTNEYNVKNNNAAATFAKFKNVTQSLSISLGNALLPALTSVAKDVIPLVDKFGKWAGRNKELVGTGLKVVAVLGTVALGISALSFAYGTYQKAMVLANASSAIFSGGLSMVQNGLVGARMATISLSGAFALTPFGMVVAGIAAISAAAYLLSKNYSNLSDKQRVNSEVMGRALSDTIEQRLDVKRLFGTLENVEVGTKKYTTALTRLNEMSPGIVEKYNLQYFALRNLAGAEKDLINQIIKRGQVQARIDILKEKQKQFEQNKMEGPSVLNRASGALLGWTGLRDAFTLEQEQLKKDISILSSQITKDQVGTIKKDSPKSAVNNNEYLQQLFSKGAIVSDVNVNITGAPENSKVDVKGQSKFNFAIPQTKTTNGK